MFFNNYFGQSLKNEKTIRKHLISLRHEEVKVSAWKTDLEVRLYEAEVGGVAIESVHTDDEVEAVRRQHSAIVAHVKVRQSGGQTQEVTEMKY